ncbi:elongation factor 1-delta-like [Solanum stenotomum]|uniref:elongation factor 1-delta-like n=1 Tax=Solanum stenotomum TaxID=172797 RepID=UPI0020CFEF3C|nr:elongation factor 1-delta-like [Solanum stenotomum]
MARDVLSIPVSTVASESAFSTGGRILDSYQSSISPKTVEAFICTQQWIQSPSKEWKRDGYRNTYLSTKYVSNSCRIKAILVDMFDLFGEETEEEKKAAEERAAALKASGKKKESGKSLVVMDVKPWDDEIDMKKLEEAVRSVHMEGLTFGASKLVSAGYGIKKLQIMLTIVDDLVSVDDLIENYLTVEPINEYVQICDIVAFNKIRFLLF